jgi:hypothetical protein
MKRDYGKGELIPVEWEVVSCEDKSKKERVKSFKSEDEALEDFKVRKSTLQCGSVRLYIKDKEGYCNCVLSYFMDAAGTVSIMDRRN